MKKKNKRQNQAKILRIFRKVHRTTGAILFIFFFFISVSGLFLGWKKHSNGVIIPNTQNGTSSNLKEWLPIDSLHKKAVLTLHKSINKNISHKIDRIDIKKNKGVAKFIFEEDLWEVQLDGATGKVLSVQKRYSDLLENIHDASS